VIRQENSQFRNVELWAVLLPRWTVPSMRMALLEPLNDPETYDALGESIDPRIVASTAFERAHASWDDARRSIPSIADPRSGVCGRECSALGTPVRVAPTNLRNANEAVVLL
jgi:hypothetical protein